MTPSRTLFWFCCALIAGIFVASLVNIPQVFDWGILLLGILTTISSFFFLNHKLYDRKVCDSGMVLGFCLLFFILGVIRLQMAEFSVANNQLRKLNDTDKKVTLVGEMIDEADVRDNFQNLKVKVLDGVVLVRASRHTDYQYLDQVRLTGKLKTPPILDGFNYQSYLMKDGMYSVMDFPRVEILSRDHRYNLFSFLYEKILLVKAKLKESIGENFSAAYGSIIEGVVLGDNNHMPKEIKDSFNRAGLSHITAVSGSNIVILTAMLMPFLLLLGFWRGQAFYVSVTFIWLYIMLVGFPASGVRAAIMATFFLLAEKVGRQGSASRIITLTGALMLLQNPFLLMYDIGFQLSFAALLGIIYVKPIFNVFLKIKIKDKKPKATKMYSKVNYLLDIVFVTLSAQLAVLPILLYSFGTISLVAPITNVLILPIIPFLMVVGFLSALLGIFSPFLGWVFYLPCWLLLTYLLKVLNMFNQPWAVTSVSHFPWMLVVLYYAILMFGIWYFKKTKTPKFLEY